MSIRKCSAFLLSLMLIASMLALPASAAEDDPTFRYELTVDGKETVEVDPGDIITVTLHLYRTDADAPYTMYAMQDEIRYDSTFLNLVEGSELLSNGIQSSDISVLGDNREFYMNYVSFGGGVQWESETRIGSFQMEVTGDSGVTTLTNEDFLVSLPDGSGSFPCEANVLTVILSTDCTVKFETNGGTAIDPVTAIYGELLERPADPVRKGMHIVGWYKDIHLTNEWDFDTDTVKGNMTLYAKWADGDPADHIARGCIICGRPTVGFLGIPLCWFCLLLLLILIVAVVFLVCYKRKRKKDEYQGKFYKKK